MTKTTGHIKRMMTGGFFFLALFCFCLVGTSGFTTHKTYAADVLDPPTPPTDSNGSSGNGQGGSGGGGGGNGVSKSGGGTCAIHETASNPSSPVPLRTHPSSPNSRPGGQCIGGGHTNSSHCAVGDLDSGGPLTINPPSQPPNGSGCCPGGTNLSAFDFNTHFVLTLRLLRDNWIASLMMMTEQLTAVMMYQSFIIGTLLDAKIHAETITIYRDLQADAHKKYQSSFQMCRFGTNVKSLAYANTLAKQNARILNEAMLSRQKLTGTSLSASPGPEHEYKDRIFHFGQFYCHIDEHNGDIDPMCRDNMGDDRTRIGRDIDFTQTVENKNTINIDFTDSVSQNSNDPAEVNTETDIIALTRNLVGNPPPLFLAKGLIEQASGQNAWQDLRSVMAIRSVAHNSISNIIGMRAKGSKTDTGQGEGVGRFMRRIMRELGGGNGMTDEAITEFLGENPSYFAQMEVLTKKMYQNPKFFVNLYDKPDNVRRMGVAMDAIKLMHDRDRFESALRREMMVSLILELKLREHQKAYNDRVMAVIPAIYNCDQAAGACDTP